MNIQDEMQNIHHKYGVSEKANYEIEKFVEKLIEDDRAEQLILHPVSNTLFVCMDKDDDILSVHRTEKGAVSKRKELLKEYLKIGVFKMGLLE